MKLFGFLELEAFIKLSFTGILSYLILWWWRKNNAFYIVIKDFRNKLPRRQTSAKPFDNPILPHITSLNLSTHETSLTESDLNTFFNELEHFNFKFVLFKNYYRSYSKNLFRFNPKAVNGNFDLVMVQRILDDDPIFHPVKPIDVFIYHLKFEYRITSKLYIWLTQKK